MKAETLERAIVRRHAVVRVVTPKDGRQPRMRGGDLFVASPSKLLSEGRQLCRPLLHGCMASQLKPAAFIDSGDMQEAEKVERTGNRRS